MNNQPMLVGLTMTRVTEGYYVGMGGNSGHANIIAVYYLMGFTQAYGLNRSRQRLITTRTITGSTMLKFIHSMIRVSDLTRSLRFYQDALGLQESHRLEFDDFSLVYLRDPHSGIEIELTWNKGVHAYDLGNGYGHVAFVTPELDACHARMTELDVSPQAIKEFKRDGELLARFFFIQDPDGYKIEILQQGGHYQ